MNGEGQPVSHDGDPVLADTAERLAAVAEVQRWCAHVERFSYERAGAGPDAAPHMLAIAARKLCAVIGSGA